MKYMLYTNICIYLIKQNPAKVIRHFKSHAIGDIGISSITLAELRYGVSKSRHIEKNQGVIGTADGTSTKDLLRSKTSIAYSRNSIVTRPAYTGDKHEPLALGMH